MLIRNTSLNNLDEGFRLDGGSFGNTLQGNISFNNAVSGFLLIFSS